MNVLKLIICNLYINCPAEVELISTPTSRGLKLPFPNSLQRVFESRIIENILQSSYLETSPLTTVYSSTWIQFYNYRESFLCEAA